MWKPEIKKYSGTPLILPALGHKIHAGRNRELVALRGLQNNKMTRRFSHLGGKTMGGELRQEVVARQGSSVYRQKQ